MSVEEQFHNRLWATTSDPKEVQPYLRDPDYRVMNAYRANGKTGNYYIHLV